MSGRSILAALLGAVVFFAWGFLFYTVLPWQRQVMHPVPNTGAITPALIDAPTGTYYYPDLIHTGMPLDKPSTMDAWNDLYRKGPLYEIRVHHGGAEMMSPSLFIWGFIHFFASTLIAVVLLRTVRPQLAGFRGQVLFLTMVGILIAVFTEFSGTIWFHYPWDRAVMDAVYTVGGWFLASLAIAAVLGRTSRKEVVEAVG